MDDDKIKVLIAEHKKEGFAFLIMFWCSLYKQSYYKKWTTREKKLFCTDFNFDISDVDNIVATCLEEEIFNQSLYDKYEIITSERIQETWVDVTTRRLKLTFIKEFLLINTSDIPNNKRVELIDIHNNVITFSKSELQRNESKKAAPPAAKTPDKNIVKEFSHQDVLDFISIPYEDRDDIFRETYSIGDYIDFTFLNNRINEKYTGIRKSTMQLTFFEYIEFISESAPKPSLNEIESAFKKMAELGVGRDVDIYLRLASCLDMVRKPFIKAPMPEYLNGSYFRDNLLEKDILDFWGFNEIANPDKLQLLVQFNTVMNNTGKLPEFREQFKCYKQFKILNGMSFKHNFENFLGKQSSKFEDGKWLSENWNQKLIEEKNKPIKTKDNGRGKQRTGYTPESYD